jgi:cell division septum initiation protein DivIVA
MKLKKLKKKIQQLEKRLREGPGKLASLKRRLQQAESAKVLKAARKSAARATASGGTKKPKRKLNLSPERRAQLSAIMKARWEAKRAAAGNSSTPTNQNSPLPPMQAPENRADGV